MKSIHSLAFTLLCLTAFSSLYSDECDEEEELLEPCLEEEIAHVLEEEHVEYLTPDQLYSEDIEVDQAIDPYMPPTPPATAAIQQEEELVINLTNPVFSQGVIITTEGGVITAPGIRIQAQKIDYTNKIENGLRIQKIVAEGDLMMEYANRAFVGTRLEYDFIKHTGTLTQGKTFVDLWFLGGDVIELKEDGTFYISNAFVTTCESQDNTWEISAKNVQITDNYLLSAKNIRFRFFKVPLFWLPAFKSNLKAFSDPPIRYKIVWDKGLGPRVTMRYRVFSWQDLNLFFRLDYRIKRGFGAAIESEYFSKDGRTTFVTRSYGAHDKSFPDENGPHRYRLQGLYHHNSINEKTQVHLTYDKLSDSRMVGDFRSDDFEINTEKRTHFLVTHQSESTFVNFHVQPRINPFQSIDQELPLFSVGVKPFEIGKTGVISSNYLSAGYLDYVYATDLSKSFHAFDIPKSTHSVRMETVNELYRPFLMGPVTFMPSVGILGIFYGNNPHHHSVGQGMITYGFQAKTHLFKSYAKARHMIEPYLNFQGLTRPTAGINDHFYFDINDGYFQLNQLKVGVRNSFFLYNSSLFAPSVTADLFTYGFFGKRGFSQTFPKTYLILGWDRPNLAMKGGVAWNNEEHLFDFANIAADWTLNEDIALGIEFRHRSRFDWRKANHDSFILDVARPIDELLHSPLSDGRDTLLARCFIRLAPKWNIQFQTRHGWGRKNEPRYNAGKIDLITMLTCSWRMRLTYERMPNDNRFSGTISLMK
jgi:hypothetical protein